MFLFGSVYSFIIHHQVYYLSAQPPHVKGGFVPVGARAERAGGGQR